MFLNEVNKLTETVTFGEEFHIIIKLKYDFISFLGVKHNYL